MFKPTIFGLCRTQILFFVFLSSVLPLLLSFLSQHLFNIEPCKMCILERFPYLAIAFFSIIGFFKPPFLNFLIKIIIVTALISLGLSIYHIGIEYNFWPGSESCTGGVFSGSSIEELEDFLKKAPVRRCDQSYKIFGILSFSIANALYSLCLFFFYTITFRIFK